MASRVRWGNRSTRIVKTAELRSGRCSRIRSVLGRSQRPHRQCEQAEQRVEIALAAHPLQAEPVHLINERLQLAGQRVWTKLEAPVRHHHHHGQMQHLGVELHKARCLRPQSVLEPSLGVHLNLQQHHRLLLCAGLR